MTHFLKLNTHWNADPNVPEPRVTVDGQDIVLTFNVNAFMFKDVLLWDVGEVRFTCCKRYHLDGTNDEGWYRGQCRFSQLAPEWGEFYEVSGDLLLDQCPAKWVDVSPDAAETRHFLFYFRDGTFECDAVDWAYFPPKHAWIPIADEQARDLLVQSLKAELGPNHFLRDIPIRTVSRRKDCDDVLFELLDGSGRFAVVHLTFRGRAETTSDFPWTTLFDNWNQFAQNHLQHDPEENT